MRVWVLASCGGLLALAAYSAEQASTPDSGVAPPEGGEAAQIKAQPRLKAVASSPMARPESQQESPDQARLNPRSAKGKAFANRPSGTDQTPPQAEQLRARVQRLRAQHASRLSSAQSLATSPLPAALSLSAPPPPTPQAAVSRPAEALSVSRSLAPAAPSSELRPYPQPSEIAALPIPPRPNVAAPETGRGLATTGATNPGATNLSPVAAANLARSYPIAPPRHQGYSARPRRSVPVLTTASTDPGDLRVAAAPRLHGAPLDAQPEDSEVAATAQISPPSAETPAPETAPAPDWAASNSSESGPSAVAPPGGSTSPAAPESAPAASRHQSGVSGSLRLTPQRSRSLTATQAVAPSPGQGAVTQPETAIAPPESLPLNPGTPRPSSLPSVPISVSAASPAEATLSPAMDQVSAPEVSHTSQTQTPEIQISETQAPVLHAASSQTASLQTAPPQSVQLQAGGSASAHLSQAQPDSLDFVDINPKSLPADHCLQVNGQALSLDAPNPAGADHQSASPSAELHPGSTDPDLALGGGLNKADLSATPCLE